MRRHLRLLALTMAVLLLVPLTAIAREPLTDTVQVDKAAESVDLVRDRPVDQSVDRVREPKTDRRKVLDRQDDRIIEHEVDRPIDRCHPRLVDNPRRCLDHERPHDINIRQLIWRLIKAHEWEKLVRLLHWLGWL